LLRCVRRVALLNKRDRLVTHIGRPTVSKGRVGDHRRNGTLDAVKPNGL